MKRLLLILVFAGDMVACICLTDSPKSAFKQSTAVFTGEVVAFDGRVAMIRTIEAFKGVGPGETVEIVSSKAEGCAYGEELTPGSRHLIFARRELTAALVVSRCDYSGLEENVTCELGFVRSRAGWWRSPLSSLRILRWLRIRRWPCAV